MFVACHRDSCFNVLQFVSFVELQGLCLGGGIHVGMCIENCVCFPFPFTFQGLVGRMAADIGHDTAERRKNAILLLEADFHGLLERKGVTEELQARLSVAGVRSISRFNAISDTRADLRQFCTRSLDRDAARTCS